MSALNTIYNLVECSGASVLGTGSSGCVQDLKKVVSLWITPDNFEFSGTETLDEDYVQQLKAEGNLIILNKIKTFTDNSSEDIVETLDDGTKQVATLGLYEFMAKFIKGSAHQAALTSLNSFGAYRMCFVDRENNIMGTGQSENTFKGFSVGMLQGGKYEFATDSTGAKQSIMFQFTDRTEFDLDYVFISKEQLEPYRPLREDGIHEVVLSYASVPANASTEIVVKATMKQNGQPFTGAVQSNFLITRQGATITPSGFAESPNGTYTFTVTANSTNDVITSRLYDSSNNRAGIVLSDDVYKSAIVSTTVV